MLTECCPKLQESNRSAQARQASPGVAVALFAEAVLLKIIALLHGYFCFGNWVGRNSLLHNIGFVGQIQGIQDRRFQPKPMGRIRFQWPWKIAAGTSGGLLQNQYQVYG